MKISWLGIALACAVVSACTQGSQSAKSGFVKKSDSGICHEPGSSYYTQTKNFTPFDSIERCLKSGGRLPKR